MVESESSGGGRELLSVGESQRGSCKRMIGDVLDMDQGVFLVHDGDWECEVHISPQRSNDVESSQAFDMETA